MLFYQSTIESILINCITVWIASCPRCWGWPGPRKSGGGSPAYPSLQPTTSQLRKKVQTHFIGHSPVTLVEQSPPGRQFRRIKTENKQWGKASTPELWPPSYLHLYPAQTHHNTAVWGHTQDTKVCKHWGKYVLYALFRTLHRWTFLLQVCVSIFFILFSFILFYWV